MSQCCSTRNCNGEEWKAREKTRRKNKVNACRNNLSWRRAISFWGQRRDDGGRQRSLKVQPSWRLKGSAEMWAVFSVEKGIFLGWMPERMYYFFLLLLILLQHDEQRKTTKTNHQKQRRRARKPSNSAYFLHPRAQEAPADPWGNKNRNDLFFVEMEVY